MNENTAMQEKDFSRLINNFIQFSELRDKMIYEINELLDRFKQNRTAVNKLSGNLCEAKKADVDTIVNTLDNLIRKVDLSNEDLANIIHRLNELT